MYMLHPVHCNVKYITLCEPLWLNGYSSSFLSEGPGFVPQSVEVLVCLFNFTQSPHWTKV